MVNLKISLAGVKDTSGAIRVCNEQIYSALIEAKKQMNDLAMVWQSDGSGGDPPAFQSVCGAV